MPIQTLFIALTVLGMSHVGETELVAGWELYYARNGIVNGEVRFKVITNSSSTPDRDDVFAYGFLEGFGIGECHYRGARKRSEVFGFNPKYDFSLDQDLISQQWRLIEQHSPNSTGKERARVARQLESLKSNMFRLSNAEEHLLLDLRAKKFKLTSVKLSADGRWLDVEFQATDFDPAKKRLTREGTMRCANKPPYYLPKEMKLKSAWPDPSNKPSGIRDAVHEHTFDYDESGDLPRLTVARRIRAVPGLSAHSKVEDTMEFNLTNQPPPKERFYLTHYGLFEPHGVTAPQPQPWFLYGSVAGIAIIVVGALLIRWSRKPA